MKDLVHPTGKFKEYNVFLKYSGNPKIALVYPSTYQASITNLFTHMAYYFLLEKTDALVDRFTLDNPDRGAVTGRKLREFDLILASANYELDLIYLAKLLGESGIEVFAEKRKAGPTILVGGLAAMSNPEPFLEIADASFIGDGEILLARLVRSISLLPDRPTGFLDSIGEGLYTGAEITRKVFVENLDQSAHPTAEIRSMEVDPVYGDGFYVEISRGCRWLCKFCLEAYAMYPFRYRSLENVRNLIREGLNYVRRRRTVIYSLSPFDHPHIRDLLNYLVENNVDFSLPSIRWDTLRPDDLDLLSRSTQKTLTLAPESMDPEISCSIGKCFNPTAFGELVAAALKKGFDVKLYIMVGLPLESEESILETVEHVKELYSYSRKMGRRLTVSLNPLIPKPHTPLQDYPLLTVKEYLKKVKFFESKLGRGAVSYLKWIYAYEQSLIALGNRSIGRLATALAFESSSKRKIAELATTLKVDIGFPLRHRTQEERPWRRVIFPLDHIVDKVAL